MLGEIVKGQYQVVQILSSSSYCQTYLAHDISQNQPTPCIIKHLLPASTQTSSMSSLRRLFTREVAALEKLGTYSQVPQLLDYFEENQQFYLVQEYIAGQALSAILLPGVRWQENQVIELLYDVLSILEVVHAHGLIHRDIKPSNLIHRERDAQLVLIDFGSVKQAWTQVVTSYGQTNANYAIGIPATVAIGTPGYMPSEQSRGRPRPSSDIYALGMVAIQALTGMHPTLLLEDSETGEVIWQHLGVVSQELGAIINQMVRYHFSDRYSSATEVLAVLQPLVAKYAPHKLKDLPVVSTAKTNSSKSVPGVKTQTSKTSKRANNMALWLGMAIGLISALGLILGTYYFFRRDNSVPPASQSQALETSSAYAKLSVAQTLTAHTDAVWTVAISRDGQTLVSGGADNTIKVWNLKTRQLNQTLKGHTDTVRSVAISPDGEILASGSADKTIKVWNLYTGKQVGTLSGHSGAIWSVAISRDGRTLVSGGEDGKVNVWNLQTGELRQTLPGNSGKVFFVALSRDGQTCAAAGSDRSIKIWNWQTGKLLRQLKGHSDAVRSVVFSPDGQKLASASWDKTIKIWNWQTGEELGTLKGHNANAIAVAFFSDGKTLASASNDRTIKIWDVQTKKLLRTLTDHKDWVLAIATSPVDRTLVSSSKDKTIKIWQ